MPKVRSSANSPHPGAVIRKLLSERNWSQNDLADILKRPVQFISELINGRKSITVETALKLAKAFGKSPAYWLKLQTKFDLSQAKPVDGDVETRASIYKKAPIQEMFKLGWLKSAKDDLGQIEQELCSFFEISSLDEEPKLVADARMSADYNQSFTASQMTWLYRAKHLAESINAAEFCTEELEQAAQQIPHLTESETSLSQIPKLLSAVGVRLVFLEHLQQTKIDGAAFWLTETEPVIALSLRYDRVDNFAFTLLHELAHIALQHQSSVDDNLVGRSSGEAKSEKEQQADKWAQDLLIPPIQLEEFIESREFRTRRGIEQFAGAISVHPGIVVGRLQHLGHVPYWMHRELLPKVRHLFGGTDMGLN